VEAMLRSHGLASASVLAKVVSVWSGTVGERIGKHATPTKIEGDELFVAVDHAAWATELKMMSARIVRQLEEVLGDLGIRRLKVYVRASNDLD
jgi:predicted nucleic acid-binding Zn ribbon protein